MFTVIKLKKLEWPLAGCRHSAHSDQLWNPPSLLGLYWAISLELKCLELEDDCTVSSSVSVKNVWHCTHSA
jgi:hypothetical protein